MTPIRPAPRLAGAPNFRDLAGLPTEDGARLRAHRIYRSGTLASLTDDDWDAFAALGVRLFVDLRSAGERTLHAVPWRDGAPELLEIEILDDARASGERVLRPIVEDASGATARNLLLANYAQMPESFAPFLRPLFERLADDASLPAVIACTAGQDRTGFVIALLLAALGVPHDRIVADYHRSAEHYDVARTARFIARALAMDEATPLAEPVMAALRAHPDYLASAFAALEEAHGSVDGYLAANGVDPELRARLRETLLEA